MRKKREDKKSPETHQESSRTYKNMKTVNPRYSILSDIPLFH